MSVYLDLPPPYKVQVRTYRHPNKALLIPQKGVSKTLLRQLPLVRQSPAGVGDISGQEVLCLILVPWTVTNIELILGKEVEPLF